MVGPLVTIFIKQITLCINYVALFLFLFTVYFISIKPVLSDHLSYVTIFHCSLERSYKTGLSVYHLLYFIFLETIEKRDISVLFPVLTELGGWPLLGNSSGGKWSHDNYSLDELLANLMKYYNNPLIGMHIYTDHKQKNRSVIYVSLVIVICTLNLSLLHVS